MSLILQKSSNRNIVLSTNAQANYGEVMGDAYLTFRLRFDPSSAFSVKPSSRNDKMMAGKGTEFATSDTITAWDTDGTIKAEAGITLMGLLLSLTFGEDISTVSGTNYLHTFQVPQITATMPCTCIYVEETADQKRKFQDMSVKTLSIDIPERGSVMLTADFVGTGRWTEGPMLTALPALIYPEVIFLASDVWVTITPTAGAAVSFVGRQKGISIKLDRGTVPFQSSGDGLYAGSNATGQTKFSVDLTIAANSVDDVNQWFEQGIRCAISIGTNPANTLTFGFLWPSVRFKANKVGQTTDVVTWALSFDETTAIQIGATPAISATCVNVTPAYLVPA